jgi:hypothetical protein
MLASTVIQTPLALKVLSDYSDFIPTPYNRHTLQRFYSYLYDILESL